MWNTVITNLQIFAIGLSFGLAGPCLLFCTPVIVAFVAGRRSGLRKSLFDISIFLSGRFVAYVALGAVAGSSGAILRRMIEPGSAAFYMNQIAGLISIFLGALLVFRKHPEGCGSGKAAPEICGAGGLFAIGFLLGISPCAPLAALLLQIALMSRGALDGAAYAASFGLGTAVSGFILIGALAGILKGFADRFARSAKIAGVFRLVCAALLFILGSWLMVQGLIFKR
jgi:sulfite exporter TauE/SafE